MDDFPSGAAAATTYYSVQLSVVNPVGILQSKSKSESKSKCLVKSPVGLLLLPLLTTQCSVNPVGILSTEKPSKS